MEAWLLSGGPAVIRSCTLAEYVDAYATRRPIAPASVELLRVSCRLLASYLERSPTLPDLSDDTLNGFVQWLEAGRRPATVKKHRANILSLWRDAWHGNLVEDPPARIRVVRLERSLPDAWTIEEIQQLISTAEKMRGRFRKTLIPKSWFWHSMILGLWDTGLRIGDLLEVRRPRVTGDGRFRVLQRKTQHWKDCQFRRPTLELIDSGLDGRVVIWPLWASRRDFYKAFKRIVRAARIRPGTTRWIRRSAASYVERDHPGAATEFLGHRDRTIADRHYIDPRIARPALHQPPELG